MWILWDKGKWSGQGSWTRSHPSDTPITCTKYLSPACKGIAGNCSCVVNSGISGKNRRQGVQSGFKPIFLHSIIFFSAYRYCKFMDASDVEFKVSGFMHFWRGALDLQMCKNKQTALEINRNPIIPDKLFQDASTQSAVNIWHSRTEVTF